MGMFSMRKPRRFHHEYIYADDRKKRLEAIEQRAKAELGQTEKAENQDILPRDSDRFRGAFTPPNSHLHRRGQSYGVGFGSRGVLVRWPYSYSWAISCSGCFWARRPSSLAISLFIFCSLAHVNTPISYKGETNQ